MTDATFSLLGLFGLAIKANGDFRAVTRILDCVSTETIRNADTQGFFRGMDRHSMIVYICNTALSVAQGI